MHKHVDVIKTRYSKWIILIGYIIICSFILFSYLNSLNMKYSVVILLLYSFVVSIIIKGCRKK